MPLTTKEREWVDYIIDLVDQFPETFNPEELRQKGRMGE